MKIRIGNRRDINRIKTEPWDWLLIIGTILAPMTWLRVWKIGPAELLCFVWAIRFLSFKRLRLSYVGRFFAVFLGSMLLGTVVCQIVSPGESSLRSWPTWIYFAVISCTAFDRLKKNDIEYNAHLLDLICILSAGWYYLLYLYSLSVSRQFFGISLWYYNRYAGGGSNPHQLAGLMTAIVFWLVYRLVMKKRIVFLAALAIAIFLLRATQSSTGIAAVVLGLAAYIVVVTLRFGRTGPPKAALITLELVTAVLIVLLFSRQLYGWVYEWISDDSNGLGRFDIWSTFGQAFLKSPFFGLGPGAHARGGDLEFHNSYLEIAAASGLVGFLAFSVFTVRIFKKVWNADSRLLSIIIALYGYSFGGFAVRRLPYWIVLVVILVICEQMPKKQAIGEQ